MKRFFKLALCGMLPLMLLQCGGSDSWVDSDNDDQIEYDRTNLDYTMIFIRGLSSSNGIDEITIDMEARTILINGNLYSTGNLTHEYEQISRKELYTLVINSSNSQESDLYGLFRINYTKGTKNRTYGYLTYWTISKDGDTAYGASGDIEVVNKY